MIGHKILVGQIDTGIHPELNYLSGLTIRLTNLDKEGNPFFSPQINKGDLHGSQVASIICGPFYDEDSPRITEIEAVSIPSLGKTMLCLLRALDIMLTTEIRILCLPIGVNIPTLVFRPFIKAFTSKGVLVVAPSGNKGKGTVLAPGSYPEVLTVGALDKTGNEASYSGRMEDGSKPGFKPNILARGEFPNPVDSNSDKTIKGTSMACAYIAGKAARIWQKFPESTLSEIRTKLDAGPPHNTQVPYFLGQRYIDSRLKTNLQHLRTNEIAEGIIISGHPEEVDKKPFQIDQLLKEIESMAGCAPLKVNYFSAENVVHIRATRQFFEQLFQHNGLFCAQAVDVSMFDM